MLTVPVCPSSALVTVTVMGWVFVCTRSPVPLVACTVTS